MILSLGATFSQSFGPNGATCNPFVSIFMISGDLICVHVSRCQPEAVKKIMECSSVYALILWDDGLVI